MRAFQLCLLTYFPLLSYASEVQQSTSSDSSVGKLICHDGQSDHCYPHIFEPTSEFQVVQDDQIIPNGLHVRVNLETGVKEARLNDPTDHDSSDISKEAVLVESNALETDRPIGQLSDPLAKAQVPKSQTPPAYSNHGKISEPKDPQTANELGNVVDQFRQSLSSPTSAADLISALTELEDLAHDIYYGLEFCKDRSIMEPLVDMLNLDYVPPVNKAERKSGSFEQNTVSSLASLVLGNSIQNNPTAIEELNKLELNVTARIVDTLHRTSINFKDRRDTALSSTAQMQSRLVYALRFLLDDVVSLQTVVLGGYLEKLLEVFDVENIGRDDKDQVRRKLATTISDNFIASSKAEEHVKAHYASLLPQSEQKAFGATSDPAYQLEIPRRRWCEAFDVAQEKLKKVAKTDTAVYSDIAEANSRCSLLYE